MRGQSAFDVAEQIEEGTWMIPTSTSQSHDLRQQPLADAARLDEIERKIDRIVEELQMPTAIGYCRGNLPRKD